MAIRGHNGHYGHYGHSHFQVWHDNDWYPLKECQITNSVVKRSCQRDFSIKSYESFCKLIRKSADFTIQKWHVGQKVSNTFSSAPIFKHQTFFLQELYQNERIQQIPVDLGILGHSVPSYCVLLDTDASLWSTSVSQSVSLT